MSDGILNPDGTVRIVDDRRLLRTRRIDPVIVETHELYGPWQDQADRQILADRVKMAALMNQGIHHVHTRPYRTVRWDRPAFAAD